MTVNTKPTPLLVYTPKALRQMITQLRKRVHFALDTESDSLYRYYPKICLIQLSLPVADQSGAAETGNPLAVVDYLIDPLAKLDLAPFGALLADPKRVKVFHDAEYDVLLLKRTFDAGGGGIHLTRSGK